jgi:STE24 endopeptidase
VTAPTYQPAARDSEHPSLWSRTPSRAEDWFDQQALDEARAYAAPLNRLRLLSALLTVAVAVAVIVVELAPRLLDRLDISGWALQLLAVIVALELVDLLWSPWIPGYISLVYDKRHGLSTQTFGSYVSDVLKSALISVVLNATLLIPVYAIIRSVDGWWFWAWLLFVAFSIAIAFAYPVVIMPRFNKFTPMESGDLRSRIEAVASRAGEEISGVFTMDASKRTRRDNAFVAGFGPTKRVVLYDTMLEHPPEVIEQVVAHEIGHYRLAHVQKSVVFQSIVMLAVFAFLGWFTQWEWALDVAGVDSIEEPAALPLLLFGLGIGFKASAFLSAWYSRAKERQADLEALELLAGPDAFIDVWRRMAPKNKAELEPPWWKRVEASHPDIAERMAFGAEWQRRNTPTPERPPPSEPATDHRQF